MIDPIEDEDVCAPACRVARVRFVCPENGTRRGTCPTCSRPSHPHLVEELAPAGARPKCPDHGPLVRA